MDMTFVEAIREMRDGYPMRLPHWRPSTRVRYVRTDPGLDNHYELVGKPSYADDDEVYMTFWYPYQDDVSATDWEAWQRTVPEFVPDAPLGTPVQRLVDNPVYNSG